MHTELTAWRKLEGKITPKSMESEGALAREY
jgi:hypothetical protein